jgi:hypothetical protein
VVPVEENISYFGLKKNPVSYLECVLNGHCERKLVSDMLHCDVFRGLRSCPFADILQIVAHRYCKGQQVAEMRGRASNLIEPSKILSFLWLHPE